jgi:hypothetical protein
MSGIIHLSAWQAVELYGLWKPLRILNWATVLERKDLTFQKLYTIGLTEGQLLVMQPDKHAWISNGRIKLCDIGLVPSWRIHASRDMNANIIQIAQLNLSAEFLQHTGVSFTDLVDAGLTLNLMMIFPFDLTSWIHLGLYRDFITQLTDVQSIALFKMPTSSVMMCVKEKAANSRIPSSETN